MFTITNVYIIRPNINLPLGRLIIAWIYINTNI